MNLGGLRLVTSGTGTVTPPPPETIPTGPVASDHDPAPVTPVPAKE